MYKLILLTTALLVGTGCAEDFEAQPADGSDRFDIEVSASTATRTTIDGVQLNWTTGDKMAVFAEGVQFNRQFTCTDASAGTFSGSFIRKNESRPSIGYYAYYPFVLQSSNSTSTTIRAVLPKEQTAPFDSSADFMVAEAVTGNYDETDFSPVSFTFSHHLFSILRITVKNTKAELQNEKLVSVMLRAQGEVLAGGFSFDVTQPEASATFSEAAGDLSDRVEVIFPEADRPTLGLGVEHVIYAVVKPNTAPIASLSLKVKTDNFISDFMSQTQVMFTAGRIVSLPALDLNDTHLSDRVRTVVLWGDSITSAAFLSSVKSVLGSDWNVVRAGIPGDISLSIAARQGGIQMVTGSEFTLPASSSDPVSIDGIYATQDRFGQANYTKIGASSYWYADGNCSLLNPCTIQGIECNVSYDSDTKGFTLRRNSDGEPAVVPAHSDILTYGAKTYKGADLIVIYMGANSGGHSSYQVLCNQHKAMIDYTDKKEAIVLGFNMDISLQWGIGYWSQEYVDLFTNAFGRRFIDMRTEGSKQAEKLLLQTNVISSPEQMSQADREAVAIGDWPESFFTDSANNVHPNTAGSFAMALLLRERMEELGYFD